VVVNIRKQTDRKGQAKMLSLKHVHEVSHSVFWTAMMD